MRMIVKYEDYKQYEGKSTIKYGDVVDDKNPGGMGRNRMCRRRSVRSRKNKKTAPFGHGSVTARARHDNALRHDEPLPHQY